MDTRERDGSLVHLASVAFALAAITVLILIWKSPSVTVVIVGFLCGFLAYRTIRRMLPDWAGQKDVVGELVLTGDMVRLDAGSGRTIHLGPQWSVHVASNHIQGKPIAYKGVTRNGLGTMRFTGPLEEISAKFVITSPEQHQALIGILSEWYRSGLRLTESMGESSAGVFLLNGRRTWSDLQKAKLEVFGEGLEHGSRE